MTKKLNNLDKNHKPEDLDNICENCNIEHETVYQNLILTGFKVCESCILSALMTHKHLNGIQPGFHRFWTLN